MFLFVCCVSSAFTFSMISESEARVGDGSDNETNGYSDNDSGCTLNIIIPNSCEIDGRRLSVVEIGRRSFSYCGYNDVGERTNSVHIPASVRIIGVRAFEFCAHVTSFTFDPNSQLTRIEEKGLNDLGGLEKNASFTITLPSTLTYLGDRSIANTYVSIIYCGYSTFTNSDVFYRSTIGSIKVPEDYGSSLFCGKEVQYSTVCTPIRSPTAIPSPTPSVSPSRSTSPSRSISSTISPTPSSSISPSLFSIISTSSKTDIRKPNLFFRFFSSYAFMLVYIG